MNSEEQDIDLIERFFREELNSEELNSFEQRIKTDSAFAGEVIAMRDIFYSVKANARANLKLELAAIQNSIPQNDFKKYNPNKLKIIKWVSGAVIVAAVITGISFWYINGGHKTIRSFQSGDTLEQTDSLIENATPGNSSTPPGPTIIKDPSDTSLSRYKADIRFEVKDPESFKIRRLGFENGLYKFEITADGKTFEVSNPNPDLDKVLLKKAQEGNAALKDSITMQPLERVDGIDN